MFRRVLWTVTAIGFLAVGLQAQPRRYDVESEAGKAQLKLLSAGIERLRACDKTKTCKVSWSQITGDHVERCEHRSWFFLPWHRLYLDNFEKIIRDVLGAPNFAIPYWRFARDPGGEPQKLGVPTEFEKGPLGKARNGAGLAGDGNLELTGALMSNVFCNYDGANLGFIWFGGDQAGDGALEFYPHNRAHTLLGTGPKGEEYAIRQQHAAEDPLFWVLHSDIDRLWTYWMAANPGEVTKMRSGKQYGSWRTATAKFYGPDGKPREPKYGESLSLQPLYDGAWTPANCKKKPVRLVSQKQTLVVGKERTASVRLKTRSADLIQVLESNRGGYLEVRLERVEMTEEPAPATEIRLNGYRVGTVSFGSLSAPRHAHHGKGKRRSPPGGILSYWISAERLLEFTAKSDQPVVLDFAPEAGSSKGSWGFREVRLMLR